MDADKRNVDPFATWPIETLESNYGRPAGRVIGIGTSSPAAAIISVTQRYVEFVDGAGDPHTIDLDELVAGGWVILVNLGWKKWAGRFDEARSLGCLILNSFLKTDPVELHAEAYIAPVATVRGDDPRCRRSG